MREILESISNLMIELDDSDYSDDQIKSKWLGNKPATTEDIKGTEERLKIDLPQDYKDFLMISNGFHAFSPEEPTFLPFDRIDYLKNIDPDLIKIWFETGNEATAEALEKSIIVAGVTEDQSFLIIPPENESDNWSYWKFASWIPGEEPYDNFFHYLNDVQEFLNDEIN